MPAKEPTSGGVSRRGFLKGASLGVAAGALLGAAQDGTLPKRGTKLPLLSGKQAHPITFILNGKPAKVSVHTGDTLLETLRETLNLTGAKPSCERGGCGACTVLLDGEAVNSCLLLSVDVAGHRVETVEGLAQGGRLHPIQEAFIAEDAFQCGFCTSGMLMSCKALLDHSPHPSQQDVREALAGNLCRCGTYQNIFRAMAKVGGAAGRGR